MFAVLLAAALASSRDDLENALLARAMGEHELAHARLLTLSRTLAADDPTRAWALHWLATSHLERHDPAAAKDALRECLRAGSAREICEDRLARLELEASAMHALPTTWTFDEPHGVILPGAGRMRVDAGELLWVSPHDPSNPGTLMFGVDLPPRSKPTTFTAKVRSEGRDAWIGVVFVDTRGQVYAAREGILRLLTDAPVVLSIDLSQVSNVEQALVPGQIERILIRDMSALNDDLGGSSLIILDDLTLR